MATLTVRLSKEQMQQLEEAAAKKKQSVSVYVIEQLSLNRELGENTLTQEEVLDRVDIKIESGKSFTIPDLFDLEEWQKFTNTVSIGRVFRIASKKPNSAVSKVADFIEKKSGKPAVYRKK
ncbi:MAG: DUF1413 domain-containing protein [Acetobacterium sp.]|nr:DUF1413 domain-containing protein [Acetobacterium sp.]